MRFRQFARELASQDAPGAQYALVCRGGRSEAASERVSQAAARDEILLHLPRQVEGRRSQRGAPGSLQET